MMQLNSVGAALGKLSGVNAMTDVTGFGLRGHLLEICQGSHLNATIDLSSVPVLDESITDYIEAGCVPGGSQRNWQSINKHVGDISSHDQALLCDPQTSGGLLVAVSPNSVNEVPSIRIRANCYCRPIGKLFDYDASVATIEVSSCINRHFH